MSICVGIRHEDKYKMELRSPIIPKHAEWLIKHQNIDLLVQTSPKRIFTDDEYHKVGAKIVFFSHVIKGQSYNMPMLKRMMELGCNLIDYERIVDEQNKRLIFFGKYAGFAGMINTIWSFGLRLKYLGKETKLTKIKQAHTYNSLAEAKEDISMIGQKLAEKGITEGLKPFVVGFTGYGNASNGAQEILGLLPVKEISPEKLLTLKNRSNLPENIIYKVIFREEDIYERIDGKEFDLQDLYTNPHDYKSKFEKYVPHLSVLMNCMYWDSRYPRILTKEYLKKLYAKGNPKLTVIGDITCDPDGSIECTHTGTHIEDPIFVYDPITDTYKMGYEGNGILDMAVDILPSELPRDASMGFSEVLKNFVKPIAYADYSLPYEELDLPRSLKKALILHNGELTPNYKYLEQHLQNF